MRLVLWVVLACTIGLLIALDSLVVRATIFPDTCFYKLARALPKEVDILIIGSSRMRRGVDPDQLAHQLGISNLRVVNFGHGGSTPDADYLILDDLLRTRTISLILVEANIEYELDARTLVGFSSYAVTRYFIQFASFRQLLAIPFFQSDQPIALRLYDTISLTSAKIESELRAMRSGRVQRLLWSKVNRHSDLADRQNICWHHRFDDPPPGPLADKRVRALGRHRAAFYEEHADWLDEGFFEPVLFTNRQRRAQVDFMRRTVALAQDHGSRIAFVNLRRYFIWPPGPEFLREFDERVGAPLLVPDKQWLQTIQQDGYHDASHLAASGRTAYTTWLAEQLTSNGLWPGNGH